MVVHIGDCDDDDDDYDDVYDDDDDDDDDDTATDTLRLVGNFTLAAKDLSTTCKIDFDEQADEWLKEVWTEMEIFPLLFLPQVQPNAKKLAEHNRKKERKVAEKDLAEKKERIRKAKEAREAAAKEARENPQVSWSRRSRRSCRSSRISRRES